MFGHAKAEIINLNLFFPLKLYTLNFLIYKHGTTEVKLSMQYFDIYSIFRLVGKLGE